MLRIEHLTKTYGEKKAVDDLSLHIQPGEIYGFIGHNGAGKTTTLKSVTGILPFDQGEIFIDGTSIKQDPLGCKKKIAYIPDNPDLYDYMSGTQYLNFIGGIFGVPSSELADKAHFYANEFSLIADLDKAIGSYSHGMKQKLAVIGALIHDPKLVLMDEPFVGLDPKAAFILKQIMREMCNHGSATFFSTHVLEVAEKLCDKVAIIKDGRLIKSGTMEEVKGDETLEEVFISKKTIHGAGDSFQYREEEVQKRFHRRRGTGAHSLCVPWRIHSIEHFLIRTYPIGGTSRKGSGLEVLRSSGRLCAVPWIFCNHVQRGLNAVQS